MERKIRSNNPTISDEQARIYDEQIERIRRSNARANKDELFTAVIEDAKRPESPLHDAYMWDKDAVFEMYLRERTREIFISIEVEIVSPAGEIESVRKYEYIKSSEGTRVESIIQIQINPEAIEQVRARLANELLNLYRRYERYQTAFPQIGEVTEQVRHIAEELSTV